MTNHTFGRQASRANRFFGDKLPRSTAEMLQAMIDQVRAELIEKESRPIKARRSPSVHIINEELAQLRKRLQTSIESKDPNAVGADCVAMAKWAERHELLDLAEEYYHLAITLNENDTMSLYRGGRLARKRADYDKAESLLTQSIERGSTLGQWAVVALAYSGLGNLHKQKGIIDKAEEAHVESLKIALDHDVQEQVNDAFQNLAVLAFESGRSESGVFYARRALDAQYRDRVRIARLANDLAYIWLTVERVPDRCLPVFYEALKVLEDTPGRLVTLGNIAHTLGKLGRRTQYLTTITEIESLIAASPGGEAHASALLDAAHGAVTLNRVEEALSLARRAQQIAQKRGERFQEKEIGHFIRFIAADKPFVQHYETPNEERLQTASRVRDLVHELIEVLR